MQLFASTLLLISAIAAAAAAPLAPCNLELFNVLAYGDYGELEDFMHYNPTVQVNCMLENDQGQRMSSFMYACRSGYNLMAMTLLEKAREAGNTEFVTDVDRQGRTALHEVCAKGAGDVVEMLLNDERVDVNAQDSDRRTPVMLAVLSGSPSTKKVMKMLMGKEPDLSLADKDGYRIFDYIKEVNPSLMGLVEEVEAYNEWCDDQSSWIPGFLRRGTAIKEDYGPMESQRELDLKAMTEGIRRRFEAAPKRAPAQSRQSGRLADIEDVPSDDEDGQQSSSSKGADKPRSSSPLSESDDDGTGKDPLSESEDDGEAHGEHTVSFPEDGAPAHQGYANDTVDRTGESDEGQQITTAKSEFRPSKPTASSNSPKVTISSTVEKVDETADESKAEEQPAPVPRQLANASKSAGASTSSSGSSSSGKSDVGSAASPQTEEPAKLDTVLPPAQDPAKAENVKVKVTVSGFFLTSRCNAVNKSDEGKRLIFPTAALIAIILLGVGA